MIAIKENCDKEETGAHNYWHRAVCHVWIFVTQNLSRRTILIAYFVFLVIFARYLHALSFNISKSTVWINFFLCLSSNGSCWIFVKHLYCHFCYPEGRRLLNYVRSFPVLPNDCQRQRLVDCGKPHSNAKFFCALMQSVHRPYFQ